MTILNYKTDKISKEAILIMRPSVWGNPFLISDEMTREQAVRAYKTDLIHRLNTGEISVEDLASLHGKDLICCCAPKLCHGEVLEGAAAWAVNKLKEKENG